MLKIKKIVTASETSADHRIGDGKISVATTTGSITNNRNSDFTQDIGNAAASRLCFIKTFHYTQHIMQM